MELFGAVRIIGLFALVSTNCVAGLCAVVNVILQIKVGTVPIIPPPPTPDIICHCYLTDDG